MVAQVRGGGGSEDLGWDKLNLSIQEGSMKGLEAAYSNKASSLDGALETRQWPCWGHPPGGAVTSAPVPGVAEQSHELTHLNPLKVSGSYSCASWSLFLRN